MDAEYANASVPAKPGVQRSDSAESEPTAEFLKFTFTVPKVSEVLRAGRSEFLIRDEISAEL